MVSSTKLLDVLLFTTEPRVLAALCNKASENIVEKDENADRKHNPFLLTVFYPTKFWNHQLVYI